MAETVFVFGAGASAEAGAPTMGKFMDAMEDIATSQKSEQLGESFGRVKRFLTSMDAAASRVELDTQNIESVLSMIEMARIIGRVPLGNGLDPSILYADFVRLLTATLEESIRLHISRKGATHRQLEVPGAWTDFGMLVNRLRDAKRSCAILTLNYDCLAELSLARVGIPYDYCLQDTASSDTPILKLHGSLNWGVCPTCGIVQAVPLREYTENLAVLIAPALADVTETTLPVSKRVAGHLCATSGCGGHLGPSCTIVPPSWNKTAIASNLERVWKRAADELMEAKRIVIVGYSMPATDLFFRYLLACGLAGGERLRGIWIVNPDGGQHPPGSPPNTKDAYDKMIGHNVVVAGKYYWMNKTMRDAFASGELTRDLT